jgi:pyruvate/2-oxoglutarate dehydrogenase complex dihydrolipoamide dehydrogenase (E3) component
MHRPNSEFFHAQDRLDRYRGAHDHVVIASFEAAMNNVDAIVIGCGQGGTPLAIELAKRGKRVVLFEREYVGGTCINYGCTPSKAFLATAHSAGRARQAQNLGVNATVKVDFALAMNRLRAIISSFREGAQRRLAEAGVEVIHGEAAFTGERTVTGSGAGFSAPFIAIDTGASPAIPDVPGLADTPYLTNKTFFLQTTLPKRFLVLGAGFVGLELAQGMARVGSSVHIFHKYDRVLNSEEADVSAVLTESLNEDGVNIHLKAQPSRITFADGTFTLALEDGTSIEGDQLLVATGRVPNSGSLQAQRSGIHLDQHGYVSVDAQLQTSCKGIYALGEVAGQPAFTHVSWEDHRRLLSILDGVERTRDDRVLAYALYTEPQVGRAGLTYEQACARGINARCEEIPLSSVARAIEWGQERGFYRMVIDRNTQKVIGATLVGYEAAELVHVFIAHMQNDAAWQTLDESVHIHPTYCEAFSGLARSFGSEERADDPVCAAAGP